VRQFAKIVVTLISAVSVIANARGDVSPQNVNREIKFEQRLNQTISSEAAFFDEYGRAVHLGDLFDERPVVLTMGYYQCPMLCGVVLNAFVRSLLEFSPQSEIRNVDFIFISVDPGETHALALEKKRTYLRQLGGSEPEGRWHFLTGKQTSVEQVAQEIGFHFRYDSASKQYVHPSGLLVLTPDRRISSYLLGVEFPPKQLERSIQQATQKRIGSPVEQVLLLCFSGDPMSGSLGWIIIYSLRIGAIATMVGLILLIRFVGRPASARKAKM
jgi:protein SCO1